MDMTSGVYGTCYRADWAAAGRAAMARSLYDGYRMYECLLNTGYPTECIADTYFRALEDGRTAFTGAERKRIHRMRLTVASNLANAVAFASR